MDERVVCNNVVVYGTENGLNEWRLGWWLFMQTRILCDIILLTVQFNIWWNYGLSNTNTALFTGKNVNEIELNVNFLWILVAEELHVTKDVDGKLWRLN